MEYLINNIMQAMAMIAWISFAGEMMRRAAATNGSNAIWLYVTIFVLYCLMPCFWLGFMYAS